MPNFYPFDGGLVERTDSRLLKPGDLTSAIGGELRPGSKSLFTTGMRKNAGTLGAGDHVPGSPVFAQHDAAASSRLIAGVAANLFEAAPALSAMSGSTAVTIDGATLAYASTPKALVAKQASERLFLASGVGVNVTIDAVAFSPRRQNLIRKADGTYLLLSLIPPTEPPEVAATLLTQVSPSASTTSNSGWNNLAKAYDTNDLSRAYAIASPANPSRTFTAEFADFTAANHKIKVLHSMGGGSYGGTRPAGWIGAGGTPGDPGTSSLKIEFSSNSGSTWTTLSNKSTAYEEQWSEVDIADGSHTSMGATQIRVRFTLTFVASTSNVSGYISTLKCTNSPAANQTAPLGFRYVVTEWDDTNKQESAWSAESEAVTMPVDTPGPYNIVTVKLPPGMTTPGQRMNNRTTHWRVYRQPEGAAKGEFDKYGLVAEIPILKSNGSVATEFVDQFEKPLTEVARPTLRTLVTGTGSDLTFYPKDAPHALYKSIDFFKESLLGVPVDDLSSVYFSPPGEYESRPSLYRIPARTIRNDSATGVKTLDELVLIFFPDWTKRIQHVPLVINGLFDPSNAAEASTTRGAAGPLAFDDFTLGNTEKGSRWVCAADREGVYITNGYEFVPWSNNLTWSSLVNLGNDSDGLPYLARTIVKNNQDKRRVEVYYVAAGATVIGKRLDFYYGEGQMREDGMPSVWGAHPSRARGAVTALVAGQRQRFTSSDGTVVAGRVLLEDPSAYFADDSQAYNASGHVQRLITTGDLPIAGLGQDGYLRSVALRTSRGAFTIFMETVSMEFSDGEARTVSGTQNPATPRPLGVFASGETLQYSCDDTDLTEKATILGLYLETKPFGGEASGLRAAVDAVAGSTSLPT